MTSFLELIALLTAFLGFFLSILFFISRNRTVFLGLAILGGACEVTTWILQQKFPQVYFLSFGNAFLYMPSFFLYITYLGKASLSTVSKKNMGLFLPWLAESLYKIYWLAHSETARTHYLHSGGFQLYLQAFDIVSYAFAIALLSLGRRYLKQYQQQPIYGWLTKLTGMLLVLHIVWLADDMLLALLPHNAVSPFMPNISLFSIFLIVCWMGFSSLRLSFARQVKAVPQPSAPDAVAQSQEVYYTLEAFLKETKIYTNPDLTLGLLADKLEMKQQTLSQAIKQVTQTNYYGFINAFRLEEFKTLLSSEDSQKFSIEGLAKQAGFSSKTTFYAFFKKAEGMTPKEYQKKSESVKS